MADDFAAFVRGLKPAEAPACLARGASMVICLGFRVWGLGFRVLGFGFRVVGGLGLLGVRIYRAQVKAKDGQTPQLRHGSTSSRAVVTLGRLLP